MFDLSLPDIISRVLILVVAFTVHEFAHAWTATELGDPTARRQGRLTLNPLAHLDPIGSLMLLLVGFGWAKPVPFQPFNLRYGPRAGTALVAVAGPASNLLMALAAAIPFQLGLFSMTDVFAGNRFLPSLPAFLSEFILINLLLLFFNMIPLPPLDGHKVATGVLPGQFADFFYRLEPWGPFILMLLIFGGRFIGLNLLGALIFPPTRALFSLLVG